MHTQALYDRKFELDAEGTHMDRKSLGVYVANKLKKYSDSSTSPPVQVFICRRVVTLEGGGTHQLRCRPIRPLTSEISWESVADKIMMDWT